MLYMFEKQQFIRTKGKKREMEISQKIYQLPVYNYITPSRKWIGININFLLKQSCYYKKSYDNEFLLTYGLLNKSDITNELYFAK